MRFIVLASLAGTFGLAPAASALELGSLMPPGNYYLTCQGCGYSDGVLACACRRLDGSWKRTRLDYRNYCPDDTLQNIDGDLRCDR